MKITERLCWIAAVTLLIAWGIQSRRTASEAAAAVAERSHPLPEKSPGGYFGSSAPQRERPGRPRNSGDSPAAKSRLALHSADPLARMTAFLQLLSASDASSLEEIRRAMDDLKSTGVALAAEEEMLNFRIGQLDGGRLLAGRTQAPETAGELSAIQKQFEGWIHSDPMAAESWLQALPPGKYHDQLALSYLAACAKDDPERSLAIAASLHPSQQTAAGEAAGRSLAESRDYQETARLLEAAGKHSPDPAQSRYLESVLSTMLGTPGADPNSFALSLVEEHVDASYVTPAVLAKASAEKARQDPVAAIQWAQRLENLKPGMEDGEAVAAAVRGLDITGVDQVAQWLSQSPRTDQSSLKKAIERQKDDLEEHGGDKNEYNKDD